MTKIEELLKNKYKNDITQYAQDVIDNKFPVGKYERLSVERYYKDLKNPTYYFDWDAVLNMLVFISLHCKHSKGSLAGKNVKLEPWQSFILANVYGFKKVSNNRRKYRKVLIEVARKNGKTTLLAGIALYHLLELDGEVGAEVYSIATKVEQSKISWNIAKAMTNQDDFLTNRIIVSQNKLSYKNSFFSPLASESKTSDGLNPSITIADEIHAFEDGDMVDVMATGMGARENPLLFQITTAGFDMNGYGYKEHEYATSVLQGSIEDESYFAIIYALDETDDYKDKTLWRKANPNLNISVYPEFLESSLNEASSSPAKLNSFKVKNLCLWQNATSRWIDYSIWEKNTETFDASSLNGALCYGGIDLSTNLDLTALVLNFPPQKEGDKHRKLYHFWLPEENIVEKERQDKVPYRHWAEQGYLTLTDGAVIDYSVVAEKIKKYINLYNIQLIAADKWRLLDLVRLMPEYEDLFVEFSQGLRAMSPASLEYERLIKQGKFATNNNPIINWMISNAEIKLDENSNIKVVKPKRDRTGKRIDGVIADIMATYTAITMEDNKPKLKPEDMVFFF
jgi:phage terminase large subunit-like protein